MSLQSVCASSCCGELENGFLGFWFRVAVTISILLGRLASTAAWRSRCLGFY